MLIYLLNLLRFAAVCLHGRYVLSPYSFEITDSDVFVYFIYLLMYLSTYLFTYLFTFFKLMFSQGRRVAAPAGVIIMGTKTSHFSQRETTAI